jgi:peptidyl-tRNA hydrolase
LGIGRPFETGRDEVVDWVLEPFTGEEEALVPEIVRHAVQAVRDFVGDGLTAAMNRANRVRVGSPPADASPAEGG